ncbi:hypothetical protein HCN44_005169 [Aphidius gifuensis]|uniref:BMP and activin membrane-bound inhibitor homolog n=1 Tax=Aphidius gifuensis TaxID=684658 RepID=A0A835CU04_APHGI|nr:BMP and activin membrane-bound inhibitor homolog [Aphidius gifuensis]KAF7992825.1 hypothetical protein HCN44_005169 [Aphidius gifuensis]
MWPQDLFLFVILTSLTSGIKGASVALADYEIPNETEEIFDKEYKSTNRVTCYCNEPECVPRGYMCSGTGCFTELPINGFPIGTKPEHSVKNGCLTESFKEKQCPPGLLCCDQDLCNHVDSPAMISRLNKTLQDLVADQREFMGRIQPTVPIIRSNDSWFKTATIAVPIFGFVVLLILASLAIKLLQPLPMQSEKLGLPDYRMPDNAPPLLGSPKVPLV